MGLWRVPPPGSGGRNFFFFNFRLGIDEGSSPTRLEPRRAHILGAIGPERRPFVPDSGCTLLGMGLGRVPPLGSGGRKKFFFTFRLGIDRGSCPTRLEPRRAHILVATGCVPGVWLIPPLLALLDWLF